MGKFTKKFNNKLKLVDREHYHREQFQSFMTGPEWRNVEMAREFAKFLREGNSMFSFPYFRQVFDLWRVIFRSYRAARKYNSASQILFSEYMAMDLFVGFFTAVELIPKGFFSLLIYPFLKKINDTDTQSHLADYFEKYAQNLETLPFYDHKYKESREELAENYKQSEGKTWVDWLSWKFVSMELWARRWISKPLSNRFHQEENLVAPTTDILVKFKAETPSEEAIELFKSKIEQMDTALQIAIVDDQVYSKESESDYTSVYARLSVSRYAAFKPALLALAKEDIYLKMIAGQDRVQVKCMLDADDEKLLPKVETKLKKTENARFLYHYGDRIHRNTRICLFDVPVKNLHEQIEAFEKRDGVTVEFIHNF